MQTRELYYEDPHLARFTGRVLSCRPAQGGWEVILDATAFYPEGGGQAADTGTLGGVAVTDVFRRDQAVVHLCGGPLEPGTEAEGLVDYAARFLRMQQHTGEHMVSGILHRRFGCHNTGFHMGREGTTIDFDLPIPPEALAQVEAQANQAVWQDLPVRCWYPEPEALAEMTYRSKRALPWPVRMVEVPGIDRCACCGTHVTSTGQVGLIKLLSAVSFRGGTRIEMVCGSQAFDLLNRAWQQNRQVGRIFSAPPEGTGEAARQAQALLERKDLRIAQLERRILAAVARDYAGAGDVVHFEPQLRPDTLRELADAIAQTCGGTAAVFTGGEDEGYAYCLVSRTEDLRPLGKALNQTLNGRGGGKPPMQQGRVSASRQAIEAFFRSRLE